MGCTGDNSLTIALSFGKIPHYQAVAHKEDLMHNLIQLAQEKFGKESALYQLFSIPSGEDNTDIKISQAPELAKQAKEFGDFIRDNYSFNDYFTGLVNGILFRKENPEYPKKKKICSSAICERRSFT